VLSSDNTIENNLVTDHTVNGILFSTWKFLRQ